MAISLIIPVFNREQETKKLFESLQNQTAVDFETVFVDDGSTDSTWQYLESIGQLPGVTTLRVNHGGPSRARNEGAKLAKRPYLVFIDSDDTVPSDFVETYLTAIVESQNLQLIQAGVKIHYANDDRKSRDMLPEENPISDPVRKPFLAGTYCVCKALFDSVGGFTDHLRYAEHRELALKLANSSNLQPERIKTIPKLIYTYESPGDAARPYNAERTEASEYILREHPESLDRAGLTLTYHRIVVTGHAKLGNIASLAQSGFRMWLAFPSDTSTYLTLLKAPYHVGRSWLLRFI